MAEQLALLGGHKAITKDPANIFDWPIVTEEDEQAILDVLRNRAMSGLDIAKKFEKEYSRWIGSEYAITAPNGTMAILEAYFGCGIGVGDEVIVQSMTFWASVLQIYALGATPVFAEIGPDSLSIDPNDIEHRITDRTKAIMVVHYAAYPSDMDAIMKIAKKHNLKVIEDVSHAQGSTYKGRMCGTFGDVGAMSLMTYKSFAIGEAGILVTDDRKIYERAIMFGHYLRQDEEGVITDPELKAMVGMPLGGIKCRITQWAAAMGRVQLKYYPDRIIEIDKAMNYFCDLLEDVPGLKAHRPPKGSDICKGGWYCPPMFYVPEELGGLSAVRFCEAVRAEGFDGAKAGLNKPMHTHPVFNTVDIYGHGKPTRIANSDRDLRQPQGSLPVTEKISCRVILIPHFKHYRPEIIEQYANAYRKASENYQLLLADDTGKDVEVGGWNLSAVKH